MTKFKYFLQQIIGKIRLSKTHPVQHSFILCKKFKLENYK